MVIAITIAKGASLYNTYSHVHPPVYSLRETTTTVDENATAAATENIATETTTTTYERTMEPTFHGDCFYDCYYFNNTAARAHVLYSMEVAVVVLWVM